MNENEAEEKKSNFSHCLRSGKTHKRNDEQLEDVSYQKKITFHCYYVIIHIFTALICLLTHLFFCLSAVKSFIDDEGSCSHILSICLGVNLIKGSFWG